MSTRRSNGHRGRHRATRTRSRAVPAAGGIGLLGAVTALAVALTTTDGPAGARPADRPSTAPTARAVSTPSPAPSPTSAAARTSTPAPSAALLALRAQVAQRSRSSTSVAALDLTTGAAASVGASGGMTTASAVKLQLLESLLLKRQRSGDRLSDGELTSATAMIEHSDNGAAEDVFFDAGGHDALVKLEDDLGLSTTSTVLGDDDYWGLTTTSAAQQLVLLRNLVDPHGPLDATSRALALRLLRNVEADQTWGVPKAATEGDPAVKNGWLNIDDDGGRWAVNSLGIVTVRGHTVLIAVLTQHNASFDDGKDRVRSLVAATAAAVRS